MPFKTAAGELYDTGEFAKVMDTCLQKADWAGIAARRREAQAKGRLRGIGMCYYIESTMGDPTEHAAIEFGEDGIVIVLVGTQTNGQGHDTAYTQVLHQRLNVPFEKIRIVQGDTDRIKAGGGTGGSRSLTAAGHGDQRRLRPGDRARQDASRRSCSRPRGRHPVPATARSASPAPTARSTSWSWPARRGRWRRAWAWRAGSTPPPPPTLSAWTFPNGCHIAEVEVDPDTGIGARSSTTTSSTISASC